MGFNVKKAVIPAAGWGTRWLPATHRVPKELMPLLDAPLIQWVVEEALESGITEIALVLSPGKQMVAEHFEIHAELEAFLREKKQTASLDALRAIAHRATFTTLIQEKALGLGHAVAQAEAWVGSEPFAVLLPDELVFSERGSLPCTRQLIEPFQKTGLSTIAVMQVQSEELKKYGVPSVTPRSKGLWNIQQVVEKPKTQAPSNLALTGRYVLSPQLFRELKAVTAVSGEIQLTDGLSKLAGHEGLLGVEFEGKRFDAGDRLGWLEANCWLAVRHPQYKNEVQGRLEKTWE